eukprot:9491558-Pyramimonas_sp.AAC.1
MAVALARAMLSEAIVENTNTGVETKYGKCGLLAQVRWHPCDLSKDLCVSFWTNGIRGKNPKMGRELQ